jgi:hypothetical protein
MNDWKFREALILCVTSTRRPRLGTYQTNSGALLSEVVSSFPSFQSNLSLSYEHQRFDQSDK